MYNTNSSIPRYLHIIWVGDEQKAPRNCIESWVKMNPTWKVQIWGNEHLNNIKWANQAHINSLLNESQKNGKTERDLKIIFASISDIMRYEILNSAGGFYVDADSFCIKPLEDWLFDSDFCASHENETIRPNLIANGYFASVPNHPILHELMKVIRNTKNILDDEAWIKTGPKIFTEAIQMLRCAHELTLWPSHYFIPEHYTGTQYTGHGHVFCRHFWGSHIPYSEIQKIGQI